MSDETNGLKLFCVAFGGSGIHVNLYAANSLQELLLLLCIPDSTILGVGRDYHDNKWTAYGSCTITEVELRLGNIFSVIE